MSPKAGNHAKRYARNLASFGLKTGVVSLVNLALTSYMMRQLGVETFGIWSIALTIGGSLGLVDLNPTGAVIKYVAELDATGKQAKIEGLLGAALRLSGVLSLGAFGLGSFALFWAWPYVFKTLAYGSGALIGLAVFCLASFAVQQIAGVYQQALAGLKRQDEVNAILTGGTLGGALALAACVYFGAPLWALGAALFSGSLLALTLSVLRLHRLLPGLPLWQSHGVGEWRKEVWRLGAGGYTFTLWGWAYFTLPRMILAAWLGPVPVAYVEAASKLGHFVRNLTQTLSYYLVPFLSEQGAVHGKQRVNEIRLRALPVIWLAALALAAPMLACREAILAQWLGVVDPFAAVAVAWVVIEFTFGGFAMPLAHFALAEGRLAHTRPFLAYMVPACVLAPLGGVWLGGFTGFLAAGALANIIGTLYFHWLTLRDWGVGTTALALPALKVFSPWVAVVAWAWTWPLAASLPMLVVTASGLGGLLLGAWWLSGALKMLPWQALTLRGSKA